MFPGVVYTEKKIIGITCKEGFVERKKNVVLVKARACCLCATLLEYPLSVFGNACAVFGFQRSCSSGKLFHRR